MKILIVNNRLKVYGGEGTYMVSVGEELARQGHEVQYFGLRDEAAKHGNAFDIYAQKSKSPFSIIKSKTNAKRFAEILDAYKPDIIHCHLLYFTLTPFILTEAKKRNIPVVQTVHDGKIVCPCYQLFNLQKNSPCTLCVDHGFKRCLKYKCHKNSFVFSYLAYREARFNLNRDYYSLIDKFIFPSAFMMNLHTKFGIPNEKCLKLTNFSRIQPSQNRKKPDKKYVLFFGRVTRIKGTQELQKAIKRLPDVNFIIAGQGDDLDLFQGLKNCECVGFKTGSELEDLIAGAVCTVFPSIWLENCPMGILESMALGTPVIGANVGGIPELIDSGKNGLLFSHDKPNDLVECIQRLYDDDDFARKMSDDCLKNTKLDNVKEYTSKILQIYLQTIESKGRI